jgi:hypothetical protein
MVIPVEATGPVPGEAVALFAAVATVTAEIRMVAPMMDLTRSALTTGPPAREDQLSFSCLSPSADGLS